MERQCKVLVVEWWQIRVLVESFRLLLLHRTFVARSDDFTQHFFDFLDCEGFSQL